MVNKIKNNTISEIDAKKNLNALKEIKNVETIKYKKRTPGHIKLMHLFDLLDTILTGKILNSESQENENENEKVESKKEENEKVESRKEKRKMKNMKMNTMIIKMNMNMMIIKMNMKMKMKQ